MDFGGKRLHPIDRFRVFHFGETRVFCADALLSHQLLKKVQDVGALIELSVRGSVLRVVVGDLDSGLVAFDAFPSNEMDAMILDWKGPIQTFADTIDNPDPNTQLKFPIDAVYIGINNDGKVVVADIIPDIRPGSGITRLPQKGSQLVLLLNQGEAEARNIQIGDRWSIKRLG